MTHHTLMITTFMIVSIVGGGLMLMGMTSLATERQPDGSLAITLTMAALFLFGLAGLTGNLTW